MIKIDGRGTETGKDTWKGRRTFRLIGLPLLSISPTWKILASKKKKTILCIVV